MELITDTPTHRGHVLIVEDESLLADLLQHMLEELGFDDISTARDLTTAGTVVRSSPLSLAILDVNVGNELVFPLAEELRAKGVPILFSTGCFPNLLTAEWSACPVLRKPYDLQSLATAIDSIRYLSEKTAAPRFETAPVPKQPEPRESPQSCQPGPALAESLTE